MEQIAKSKLSNQKSTTSPATTNISNNNKDSKIITNKKSLQFIKKTIFTANDDKNNQIKTNIPSSSSTPSHNLPSSSNKLQASKISKIIENINLNTGYSSTGLNKSQRVININTNSSRQLTGSCLDQKNISIPGLIHNSINAPSTSIPIISNTNRANKITPQKLINYNNSTSNNSTEVQQNLNFIKENDSIIKNKDSFSQPTTTTQASSISKMIKPPSYYKNNFENNFFVESKQSFNNSISNESNSTRILFQYKQEQLPETKNIANNSKFETSRDSQEENFKISYDNVNNNYISTPSKQSSYSGTKLATLIHYPSSFADANSQLNMSSSGENSPRDALFTRSRLNSFNIISQDVNNSKGFSPNVSYPSSNQRVKESRDTRNYKTITNSQNLSQIYFKKPDENVTFLLNSSKPFETLPASPPRPPPSLSSSILSTSTNKTFYKSRFTISKIPESKIFEEEKPLLPPSSTKTATSTQTEVLEPLELKIEKEFLFNSNNLAIDNNNNINNEVKKELLEEKKPDDLKIISQVNSELLKPNNGEVEIRISKFIVKKVGTHILYKIDEKNNFKRDEVDSSVSPVRDSEGNKYDQNVIFVENKVLDAKSEIKNESEQVEIKVDDKKNLDDKKNDQVRKPDEIEIKNLILPEKNVKFQQQPELLVQQKIIEQNPNQGIFGTNNIIASLESFIFSR